MIMIKTTAFIQIVLILSDMSNGKRSKMVIKKKSTHFKKNFYENAAWEANNLVCGIDEVGRGCLAGPLVTAAVILPPKTAYSGLKDSKILNQKDMILAYKWIKSNCRYSIGIASHKEIDRFNIWQATLRAMKKAAVHLLTTSTVKPSAILVDAVPLKLAETAYSSIPVYHFPKGEKKSTSIAAASIVAKVTRDRLMKKLDLVFPGYHFGKHKGYGTKTHQSAIETQKHTIIHRVSFLNKSFISDEDYEYEEQLSLC